VITVDSSWSQPAKHVVVSGTVALWDRGGDIEEPREDEREVVGSLSLWIKLDDLDALIEAKPHYFVDASDLAIAAFYRALTPESDRGAFPLAVEVGAQFTASLRRLSLDNPANAGRLRAVLRAAAFIGSGRADYPGLQAHQHHRSGPSGGAIERADGACLYRGAVANHTPNAARIFWWEGASRELVAVMGHDENPPI
jgi:hypothetical protein